MRTQAALLLFAGLCLSACDDAGGPLNEGPSPGTLVVSTSTEGDDPDQDGYVLTVDDVDSLDLDPTGTAELGVAPGLHTVKLLGVAGQCSVVPGTELDVDVRSGSTTPVVFVVSCPASSGARVTVTTTGVEIDPDGYRVVVDARDRGAIPINGTVVTGLEPGTRTIRLAGLASNCALDGPGFFTVTLVDTEIVSIEFAVVCTATPASRTLAFESGGDIYLAHMDGSGLRRLTFDGSPTSYNSEPAWSPDGSRIAFSKSDGQSGAAIYVMDADGANPTRLSPGGASDAAPTWSPDGRRIAFETWRDSTGYRGVNSWLDQEIYIMNADGTNQVRLTHHLGHSDYGPAWSPDGNRIAYISDAAGHNHIFVINADGTNPVQLTSDEHDDSGPEWSPDGSRIVFARFGDLFVVDPDGRNLSHLVLGGGNPTWSADGVMIAFNRATDCHVDDYGERHCRVGIWVARLVGGNASSISEIRPLSGARGPSWRP